MPRNPFVSVIVLNWNGTRCIEQCLESLLKQTYSNYEVLVVDNASTDGSPDIVRREFPSVKLLINDRNFGFAKGNNIGIKAAEGELIALFNYDAIASPEWLSRLVDAILKSQSVGVVGGSIYYYEPKDVLWAAGGKIDLVTGLGWHVGQGEKLGDHVLKSTDDIDYIPGAALLIKREVIEKVGLLDEDYFLYCDDIDWCLSAMRAGYECRFVKSAPVWHIVSFSWKRKRLVGYYYHMRSAFHLYLKHLPIPSLLVASFFQYVVFSFFEIFVFKRPIDYAVVKTQALVWNLLNVKNVLKKRKIVKKLGRNIIKNRIFEAFGIARERLVTRQYYW